MEFKTHDVDIVKILNSFAVVGMYRGDEIWNEISNLMDEIPDYTLVLIDLRQANPLQYVFCQHAFGPLFKALIDARWSQKYVIFKMHEFHKPGFFRGILKYLGSDLPRKESEKGFVTARMYAKLIVGDGETINFIGNLVENEQQILSVVNGLKQVTSNQVVEKTNLSGEIVVDALRSLSEKYFIGNYSEESKPEFHYFSFYNYLRKE